MTVRLSNALRNYVNEQGSLKHALQGGKLMVYSGAQPANPETAPSGTLLCTYTNNSGAHTAEVLATGSVTLSTGSSGSVDTITVDGVDILPAAVPFNTSLAQTALDVIAAINKASTSPKYKASTGGSGVITITAARGAGAEANGLAVVASFTTITGSDTDMASGVTPVNGLKFGASASGVLSKDDAQTWSGVAVAGGTAGWARFVGAVADSGAADSTDSQVRLDMSISTSGSDLNLTSTAIAATATQTISGFAVTLPAS